MAQVDGCWKLEHLSDAQLLESLNGALRTQRRALACVVAHLGEVEDRRLHLEAAYSSMFSYCVARLGMSEDEACRRIELARLARKFPALFAELAGGQLTLSVALLLKPLLSPGNHVALLAALRGKSIRQARELLAERFPKPDAPSSIRKLPEPRLAQAAHSPEAGAPPPSSVACPLLLPAAALAGPATASPLPGASLTIPSPATSSLTAPLPAQPPVPLSTLAAPPPLPERCSLEVEGRPRAPAQRDSPAPAVSRSSVEPLSAGRYRIQFTADAALKRQLELARNMLRHAEPTGDLAPIISRALELLIDNLLRHRFGAVTRRTAATRAPAKAARTPSPAREAAAAPVPSTIASAIPTPAEAPHTPSTTPEACAAVSSLPAVASASSQSRRSHIPRLARRAVLERDGLGCSWIDARGVRCGSQAWLEFDHRQPAGKGGSSEPDNLRLLCRAHNQLAAEHVYGREHIERMSRRHGTERAARSSP